MEILCLGNATVDAIGGPVDRMPDVARLTLLERVELHAGGCALSTAIALRRLGIATGIIGKVGEDLLGDFLHTELERAGVDTSGLVRDPTTTSSFTFILLDTAGERRYFHHLGSNASLCPADIDTALLQRARILSIGGALALPGLEDGGFAAILTAARQRGLITCMDAVFNDREINWQKLICPLLPLLDYFVPSVEEAQLITGFATPEPQAMARYFRAQGCPVVVIKLAEQGCYLLSDEHEQLIPAHPAEVVDTTGAGDAWVAGFLAGVLRELPLFESVQLGNAVAAHCIGAIGTTAGIPSMDEVQHFQRRAKN